MATTLTADVLLGFLIIYLVFYVKKPSFVVPDGVSITVGKEDLSAPVFGLQKEKEIINTLTRALYICYSYYLEILKHAQDPHKHILVCRISSQQRVFLFYIRTSEEWKEIRIQSQIFYLITKSTFSHSAKHFCLIKILLMLRQGVTVSSAKTVNRSAEALERISERVFRTQEGRIKNLIIQK